MYTEKELEVFKEQVNKTKSLGRERIIYLAAKSISDDFKALIKDDKIFKSVFYNNISLKVDVKLYYPIIYLPYNKEYFYESTINMVDGRAMGSGGSTISNITNKNSKDLFKTKFYIHTKEKELKIKEVLKLNNANEKYFLDIKKRQGIIIKEQNKYYIIQLGHSYPITYKIDKITGEIYDYSDPYAKFYPSPAEPPFRKPDVEGKWIEMKE